MGNLQPKLMVMNVAIANISISAPKVAKQIASSNDMGTQTGVNNGVSGSSILDGVIDWIKSLTDLFTGNDQKMVDTANVASDVDKTQVSVALDYTEQLNQIVNNTAVNYRDNINAIASLVSVIVAIQTRNSANGTGNPILGKLAPQGGVMSKIGKVVKGVTSVASANPVMTGILVGILAIGATITAGIVAYKAYQKHKKGKAEKEKKATQTANEMYRELKVTSEKVSITANQLEVNIPKVYSNAMPQSGDNSTNLGNVSAVVINMYEANSKANSSNVSTTAYGSNYAVSDDNDIRNAYSIVSTDTKGNDVYNYNITNHNQFDMPITKDVDYDYIEKRVIETLTNGLLKEGSSTGTIELGEA